MKFWRWLLASFAVFVFLFFYLLLVGILQNTVGAYFHERIVEQTSQIALLIMIGIFAGIGADPLFRMWGDAALYISLPLFAPLFVLFFMTLHRKMPYKGIKRGLIFGFLCWLTFSFPTLGFIRGGVILPNLPSDLVKPIFLIIGPILQILLIIVTYLAVGIVVSIAAGIGPSIVEKKSKMGVVRWLVAGLIAGIAHYLFFNVRHLFFR